jgi:Domain of unknown function (DUF4956)
MRNGTLVGAEGVKLLPPCATPHTFGVRVNSSPALPMIEHDARRPLLRVVIRTVAWYLATAAAWWSIRRYAPTDWGALGGNELGALLEGVGRSAMAANAQESGPALVPTIVAMLAALATALPVTWIYTYTRQKKGYLQSVVQTFLILPVIVAGIVVLVKHSVALAFSLGGIVTAVRFRTTLEDSKDAANIFVVTGIGLAAAVDPTVAFAISVIYNILTLGLWASDFGRAPALEGRQAGQRLDKVLQHANRTGMFVARLDDEVLKDLAPEQLEALADRAWRRRKRNAPDAADDERPEYTHMLRVHTSDVDGTRAGCEAQFTSLFSRWKYMGRAKSGDGLKVLEYGIAMLDDVTPGTVSEVLRDIPTADVRTVELKR